MMNLGDFPSKLLPILKGRIEHAVYKNPLCLTIEVTR
jgi:hypothetical protein